MSPPVPRSVILFGNRVFREVTKLKLGHYSEPKSNMTSVLIKRGDLDTQAGPERRRYEETQGEYGHPQAKECLRLPEAGREAWVRSFHGDFRGTMALLIP